LEQLESFSKNVCASTIGSCLYVLLGASITVVVKNVLIPAFQNFIYQGIHLAGCWEGEQTSSRGIFGFKFDLRQIGPHVRGTFEAVDRYGEETRKRTHNLNGIIRHNHLILQYDNKKNTELGLGAFLFSIRDGGNELYGSMMFLQTATGNVGGSDGLSLRRSQQ
jgi:hypothetical protein